MRGDSFATIRKFMLDLHRSNSFENVAVAFIGRIGHERASRLTPHPFIRTADYPSIQVV